MKRCEELRNGVARLESEREQLQTELAEQSKQLGEMKSVISAQQAKDEQAETRKIRIKQELEELSGFRWAAVSGGRTGEAGGRNRLPARARGATCSRRAARGTGQR